MHKTRTDRQQEAIERQEQRNVRTTTDQLTLIRNRPGRSLKEAGRLLLSREA
jgi:hypothetical protein